MDLAIILVHYHTPELAAEAVEALRRSLGEPALTGVSAEIVLVDNGSDPAGRQLLDSLPVRRIDPGRNLGYGGGVNRGVEETAGERLVVLNPDVLVQEACLGRLLRELECGAAVAGPRFYLDRARSFLIPPTERRSRSWELLSTLADRGRLWSRTARRVWRRHAQKHWTATEPIPSPSLSGALLAFSRESWRSAGPFDDQLPLYFEEDDWLKRVWLRGLETRYVPAAEAIHLHGQSTAEEPRSARWFAASRVRFRRRWYGLLFSRLLARLEHRTGSPQPWPARAPLDPSGRPWLPLDIDEADPGGGWLELASSPRGFPAAAHLLKRMDPGASKARWGMPEELWRELQPGTYRMQWVDNRGRERGQWCLIKPPAAE
jgi:N-acetylglucosaminyl-diphospho-decaprenol L-rhamnosyltransferase